MILLHFWKIKKFRCILHVCGDDPKIYLPDEFMLLYSPRMWRWSLVPLEGDSDISVFSTYVEMIPHIPYIEFNIPCILHVCGDDPSSSGLALTWSQYSPRMWRWSFWQISLAEETRVFSTYVEMIPYILKPMIIHIRILHVCGDDPYLKVKNYFLLLYSPRMWRWS